MKSGVMQKQFLESHICCASTTAFSNGNIIACGNHIRNVTCTSTDVYISTRRIIQSFARCLRRREFASLYVWTRGNETIREHQVRDRRILPSLSIRLFNGGQKDYLSLEITERGCGNMAVPNGVTCSEIDFLPDAINVSVANITSSKIIHKPSHSGYSEHVFLNMCVLEKATGFESMRIIFRFFLHNSGHTLSPEEREWRTMCKQPSRPNDINEQKNKQTMTIHQQDVPPLPKTLRVSKKQRVTTYVTRSDPPPIEAALPPLRAVPVNSPVMHSKRTESPVSPLELHRISPICGKCSKLIQTKLEAIEITCDRCHRAFHLECTRLSELAEITEDDFLCEACQNL